MKKRNVIRHVSLILVLVMALSLVLLLSGCAVNGTQKVDEDGNYQPVDLNDLATEPSYGLFDYIKLPFSYLLEWLYNFTKDYGLALILFALIIKVVLFPTSALSKKGMMKMSRLTPQVKELEAMYGDDKQKYQEEVNKLYKREGTGGCGGCLWSLLPMLLLLPLYYVIREPITWLMFHGNVSAHTLGEIQNVFIAARNAAHAVDANSALAKINPTDFYWQVQMLPYLKDLLPQLSTIEGVAGHMFVMDTNFLGIELATVPHAMFWQYFDTGVWNAIGQFLLPIFSGGIQWVSMWISQKLNNTVIVDKDGQQDSEMAKANKTSQTMTMMMPLMSIYIGFVAPAGLSVYWIVQGLFSMIQDVILTKHYKKIYDAEDKEKREKAIREAEEEARREKIRAEKREANPEGITENTSKKKIQQQKKQERAAAEAAYLAKTEPPKPEKVDPKDEARPYRRGRAYRPDRYQEEPEEPKE